MENSHGFSLVDCSMLIDEDYYSFSILTFMYAGMVASLFHVSTEGSVWFINLFFIFHFEIGGDNE